LGTVVAAGGAPIPCAGNYSLFPIHIDLGFDGGPSRTIESHARQLGWSVHIERTDFGLVAHSDANRENPCFLCARKRRQRLFEVADRLGMPQAGPGAQQG
jgi:tRNA 2-thiocytidine biosynthesis protein TtcA